MAINIVGFIKRLMPTLSKSDLETDMEVSMDALQVVVTSYQDFQSAYEGTPPKSAEVTKLFTEFYKEYNKANVGIKLSGGRQVAKDMLSLFANVQANGVLIQREVADISNEVIVSNAITAVKGNVLRAVEHYYFITRYALDLINQIYVLECANGGAQLSNAAKPNAKQTEFIHKNLWIYARLLAIYGQDPAKFSNHIQSLSAAVLPKDQIDEVVELYKSDQVDLFDNLPAGFVGSPIYTVRLIFAQWEADRYKQLKDKKKLLELRALHLRLLKENGSGDVNTEKELEYLQKRITDIDHTVSKIERSIEG